MDEKEIVWRYDRAQNQNQMITILHELTLIPEYQIMILIINSGRKLPERKVTALKKRRAAASNAIRKKEADYLKLADRMMAMACETEAQMKKRDRLLQRMQSADDAIRELEAERRMIDIVLKKGGEAKAWKEKDKTAQHT